MNIRSLCRDAFENSRAHGFWAPSDGAEKIPEKLCLIHSEVSEALEDYRAGLNPKHIGMSGEKPIGFPSELADTVIRIADLCGALGIDLDEAIRLKMQYNRTRPFKHGKVC